MQPVAVAWSSCVGNAICYVTSGFVDDVMFSHDGANGPESKTTARVSSSSPGGATGIEVL